MKVDRLLAIGSGLLAIAAFFYPMLTINGEQVTLFSQGYLLGFLFVAFGIATLMIGVLDKMQWVFVPTFGLLISGVGFTQKLQDTLKETVESYEKFKGFLADQAQGLGVEVEAAPELAIQWGYGVEIAMAASVLAIGAYAVVFFRKAKASGAQADNSNVPDNTKAQD